MYQVKVREVDFVWIALEMPGVSMKVLRKNDTNGAMAVLTRTEPGAVIPAHWHSRG